MTSTGILTRVCKNNSSHTDTAILPTLNTYGAYTYAIITQETCSATGTGRYTYVKDNQAITFNVSIPTAEHEYGKWSVKIAPNSTRTGILIRTCVNNSSHTETLTLPIIGADTGYTVTITKEPTCFETGKTEYFYRIGNQGFTFFGDLPMTEHKNTAVRDAKHATCTEEGYSGDVYCTDCDKLVLKGYVIEKIAHKFIDGVCTVCSKIDESINNDVSTVVSISTDDQGNTTYTFEVTAKNNSREVLADIKKVVGNAVHDGAGVKVNFGDVSIYFDNDAVQEINSTASASLSITKVDGSVTTEGDYRSAGFDLETCVIYEFSMAGATFNGGIATVSIPYSSDGKNVKVFYVDADGNKTEMQSTYDEATGMITFTTNHFSTYVITEIMDEIISPANYTVWIVAAVAVIIVLAVVGGIVVRKKNGD
jgi:hypothetical protein